MPSTATPTYRVRQLGPFEYVKSVTARPRILTAELADRLFTAASGHLPVLVEGSQSPISVKAPCEESDLDVLVAVESGDELTLAHKVLDSWPSRWTTSRYCCRSAWCTPAG